MRMGEVKVRPFSIKRNYANFQYEINYAFPSVNLYASTITSGHNFNAKTAFG